METTVHQLTAWILNVYTLIAWLPSIHYPNITCGSVFGGRVNIYSPLLELIGGHTYTLVSDDQIATPGFLSGYDAFVYTEDGGSFGYGLSAAAAAKVKAYVGGTGKVVLFNGYFAYDIFVFGHTGTNPIFLNAMNFAGASGLYLQRQWIEPVKSDRRRRGRL